MMRRFILFAALALTLPVATWAQGTPDFSGTWKLSKAENAVGAVTQANLTQTIMPVTGIAWGATSPTLVIQQSANDITITSTSFGENQQRTFVYTLDGKEKVSDDPKYPGIAGYKWMVKARWEGSTLVVFTYNGWNQVRDKYTLNGGQLTISREIEGQTGGTTSATGPQMLAYVK